MLTKQDKEFLKENFATKNDVKAIVEDALVSVKNDISSLKSNVSVLKSDVSVLKTDVSTIKLDVGHLKTEVGSVKEKLDELTAFVVPAIGNILGWTDDIHRAIVGRPSKQPHGN